MIEKVIKRRGNKLYFKWKGYVLLINGLIKKTLQNKYIKNEYFPEPYRNFRGNIRVKN